MPPQYIAALMLATAGGVLACTAVAFGWDLVRRPTKVTPLAWAPAVLLSGMMCGVGWGTRYPVGTEGVARAIELMAILSFGACFGLLLGGASIALSRALRRGEPMASRAIWPVAVGLVVLLVGANLVSDAGVLLTPPVTLMVGFAVVRWLRGGRRFEAAVGSLLSMWTVGTALYGTSLFTGRASRALNTDEIRVLAELWGPVGTDLWAIGGFTVVSVGAVVVWSRRWWTGLLMAAVAMVMVGVPVALFVRVPVVDVELPRWVNLVGEPGHPLPFTREHRWSEAVSSASSMSGGYRGLAANLSTICCAGECCRDADPFVERRLILVDDGRRFLPPVGGLPESNSRWLVNRRRGGDAVRVRYVDDGVEVEGKGSYALGWELHAVLAGLPKSVGIDVESSPWLSVQDYVSICASLGPPADCDLTPQSLHPLVGGPPSGNVLMKRR